LKKLQKKANKQKLNDLYLKQPNKSGEICLSCKAKHVLYRLGLKNESHQQVIP
jgi:hypothetical protein